MAHPGTGGDPAADLQDLFASLRSTTTGGSFVASKDGTPAQSPYYRHPLQKLSLDGDSSSTPAQPSGSSEQHQPAIMSPSAVSPSSGSQARIVPMNLNSSRSVTPAVSGDRPNVNLTTNLLSLLKFSAPTVSSPTPSQHPSVSTAVTETTPHATPHAVPSTHSVHGRGISASDLVASYMGKPSIPTHLENVPVSSSTNHQDNLLKLLNRTAPPQSTGLEQEVPDTSEQYNAGAITTDEKLDPPKRSKQPSSIISNRQSTPPADKDSPIHVFGGGDDKEPTPFEHSDQPKVQPAVKKDTLFTYVNPFEELAASAPQNGKPAAVNGDGNKRKITEPSQNPLQASSRRKLAPPPGEIAQNLESALKDARIRMEAARGRLASGQNPENFEHMLKTSENQDDNGVYTTISKPKVEKEQVKNEREESDDAQKTKADVPTPHHDDENASEAKVKLGSVQQDNEEIRLNIVPTPTIKPEKKNLNEGLQGEIADEWESADGDEPEPKMETERLLQVYLFPMKPFVSIDIKSTDLSTLTFPDYSIINIARLKKEFDPVDRTLATATPDFIVYGSPRSGGIKVIRQDDGEAKHLFADTHDRIFNLAISTANPSSAFYGTQNIIATGVSGSVYWAPILRPAEETIRDIVEEQCLIFPSPPPQSDGQLKTRAKKSSRNPEFFAIGRGKSIHIVFPAHARQSRFLDNQSVMDTENYFQDRILKISTKKSGKDFTFSEDDTTIVTLEKDGKVSFFDIRALADIGNASSTTILQLEANVPIVSYSTARRSEKSWPTSILLVDKPRPYTKGVALRYFIVGMKQNHTLQLWDLCLGKAVQEINFPHESESDAVCSISYHPTSGMVVVGHPTRNCIYFIHLSAPRYNLPPISQAKFLQRVVNKDSTLPRAEATAILSGMREYSFSNKGQIRSLELVSASTESTRLGDDPPKANDDDPVLFDLYIMHSKGVASVPIKKEDLGWSKENKVIRSLDAEQEGFIVVQELKDPQLSYLSEPSSNNGDAQAFVASATATPSKVISKNPSRTISVQPTKRESHPEELVAPIAVANTISNPEKPEKRKKKRWTTETSAREADNTSALSPAPAIPRVPVNTTPQAPSSTVQTTSGTKKQVILENMPATASQDASLPIHTSVEGRSKRSHGNEELFHLNGNFTPTNLGISGDVLEKELQKFEVGVSEVFNKVLSRELGLLYQRFNEDRRVQDAAGSAKQDAILRLVSSTLGDNVENSLSRIISTNIHQVVLPSISDTTSALLDQRVTEVLTQQLQHVIPPILKFALPEAISRGVQHPEVLRSVSEQIAGKLSGLVEKEFTATLQSTIIPTFKNLAVNVAQRSGTETENRVQEYLRREASQRKEDTAKIEQLTALVRGLSETVHMMASAQSEFQQQILQLQQQAAQERQEVASSAQAHTQTSSSGTAPTQARTPEEEEMDIIMSLMTAGRHEEGTIRVCFNRDPYCRIC